MNVIDGTPQAELRLTFPRKGRQNSQFMREVAKEMALLGMKGRLNLTIQDGEVLYFSTSTEQVQLLMRHAEDQSFPVHMSVSSALCEKVDVDLFGEEQKIAVTPQMVNLLKDSGVSHRFANRLRPLHERDTNQCDYVDAVKRCCSSARLSTHKVSVE